LKYLALVYALSPASAHGDAIESPVDESSFQVVFTAAPERFRAAGWMGARILTPLDLPAPLAPAAEPPFENTAADLPAQSS
jgi:hypothetical protein